MSDSTSPQGPLSTEELRRLDGWWRAANYLSVGQIYLLDNALLRERLTLAHVKPRLLGHWGTTPGLNLLYAHMNRAILQRDLSALFITGPGHGGPGLVASTWLEGSYTDVYPDITRDAAGMHKLFRQFSFPGGIPSHVAPETPGSIHEGGELGYALVHAYGAAFDNPDLVVCCVVGDGEAETGPLAASWHSNKFVNPARDGAVLPVLHLNGYKIANPTLLARIPESELRALMEGYGHAPRFVTGDDPDTVRQALAAALDGALDEIAEIQRGARADDGAERPRWPMIVLRTPKGWTGPKEVDGQPAEGNWRSHQVPLAKLAESPEHLRQLEEWMRSYRPEELFDEDGRPRDGELPRSRPATAAWARTPHANGGTLLHDLRLPDFREYAVDVPAPAQTSSEATRVLGNYLRDVMRLNEDRANFRVFGPDETASNRLGSVLEATDRTWMADIEPGDDHLAADGRVMEVLSEHLCQGWLEGYLHEHEHPHGLSDAQFDALFAADRPVIFAYHGYPWLIHRLTYRRTNHRNLHVRGYKEEGTTTKPFDMVMLNDMDRYHLVMDVIDRVPGLGQRAAAMRQEMVDERLRKRAYTREHGDDPEDVRDWTLPGR